jgi:hypothetical protein
LSSPGLCNIVNITWQIISALRFPYHQLVNYLRNPSRYFLLVLRYAIWLNSCDICPVTKLSVIYVSYSNICPVTFLSVKYMSVFVKYMLCHLFVLPNYLTFNSLGIAFGGIITMSSYNKFNNNILK